MMVKTRLPGQDDTSARKCMALNFVARALDAAMAHLSDGGRDELLADLHVLIEGRMADLHAGPDAGGIRVPNELAPAFKAIADAPTGQVFVDTLRIDNAPEPVHMGGCV